MARTRKEREANIIHFSFFDLLFGAFGAFVFLMIMQVISTLNMVEPGVQKLVDETVKEKKQLAADNQRLTQANLALEAIERRYQEAVAEKAWMQKQDEELKARIVALNGRLAKLEDEAKADQARRERAQTLVREAAALQDQNRQLAEERDQAQSRANQQKAQAEALTRELADLRRLGADQQDRDQRLKQAEARLAELAAEARAQDQEKREAAAKLARAQADLETARGEAKAQQDRGEALGKLEAKNRELGRELEQARQKIAAVKRLPLTIRTASLPGLRQGDRLELALAAEGGSAPYLWEAQGALPAGLVLQPDTGVITGTPREPGETAATLVVRDSLGEKVFSKKPVSFSVRPAPQEKEGVSFWFMALAVVSCLMLAYILWGKYKARQYYKQMLAKGYKPMWVQQ